MKINLFLYLLIFLIFFTGCSNVQSKKDFGKDEKYYRIRGINLAAQGKLEDALENFISAYKIDNSNVFTLRSIGILYCKLGDYEKGKQFFEKALSIDKNDTDSIYNLATIYYNLKDYKKAIETINRLPYEKVDNKIVIAKAYIYFQLKEYEKSYVEYQILLGKEQDISVYQNYVELLKVMGLNNKIYSFLYEKYSKNMESLKYVILFSDYLTEIGAYDEAITILKNYGDNYQYSSDVIFKIAKIFLLKKDYSTALQYIKTIPEKDSLAEHILELKYEIYVSLGDKENAESVKSILSKIKRVDYK